MKDIAVLFWIMIFAFTTQGQNTINSTGNSATINGNTYSYSIGEMTLVHTATASNIVVTQGVLQASSAAVGIETVKLTKDEFNVYPNPARNVLNLETNLQEKGDLKITLYDILGKELVSKEWKTNATNERKQLSLQAYAAGYYILNVAYNKENKIARQSYKIQKLK